MDIRKEIDTFNMMCSQESYNDFVNKSIDIDTRNKVRAILDVLQIGKTSIAQAELILHLCEDTIKRCTLVEGTKRDV